MRKQFGILLIIFSVFSMSACSSIKMPNLDFIKIPEFRKEFREDAKNIGKYPEVANAPQRPNDIRSDEEWDKAAKTIMAEGEAFNPPPLNPANKAMLDAEIENLSQKVEEYKLDDPK